MKELKYKTYADVEKLGWDDIDKRMQAEFEFANQVKIEVKEERIKENKKLEKMSEEELVNYYSDKCKNVEKLLDNNSSQA
ncbi:MAG: hypothetical protein IJX17_07740 [Clostridia bacterium]|nr:hypothetical protein [Clostridia bacterium]